MTSQLDTAPEITSEINFYASWLCPFCQRVWIALLEKGVPFNFVSIDLKNKPAWLATLNPAGGVPVIGYKDVDGTHIINESLTLLEFLEDYQPAPSLYPAHPASKARARNIISFFGDKVTGPFYRALRSADKEAFLTASNALSTTLSQLEAKMSPEGPYFLGEQFTMVDIAIVPFLLRFAALKYFRGVEALEGTPRLKAYLERCKERESVKTSTTAPEGDWEEGVFKGMAGMAGERVDYSQ